MNEVNQTSLEKQQQRVREFMQLWPVIAELAGMPKSEHGKYYTQEQIESRCISLKHAYRVAKQLMAEIANS